jgi:hypothetical protein
MREKERDHDWFGGFLRDIAWSWLGLRSCLRVTLHGLSKDGSHMIWYVCLVHHSVHHAWYGVCCVGTRSKVTMTSSMADSEKREWATLLRLQSDTVWT